MRVEKVIFFCHIYQNPVWSAAIYKRNFWYYIGVSSHMDDEYKWAGVEDPIYFINRFGVCQMLWFNGCCIIENSKIIQVEKYLFRCIKPCK